MAITNGYCTLPELKARISVDSSDTADDAKLEATIEAASRAIDGYCRRRFYAANDTRYYTAHCATEIAVDDLLSVTTLKTDASGDRTYGTTWATTDYDLEPYNAVADGRPYTHIRVTPNGNYTFPGYARGVQIVGSFGYASSTPDLVHEACLLQAARLHRRKDAPFGVAGLGDLGEIRLVSALDPDVRMLLGSLVDHAAGIA